MCVTATWAATKVTDTKLDKAFKEGSSVSVVLRRWRESVGVHTHHVWLRGVVFSFEVSLFKAPCVLGRWHEFVGVHAHASSCGDPVIVDIVTAGEQ